MSEHRRPMDDAALADWHDDCLGCGWPMERCRCDRYGPDTGRAVLDAFYGNGEREEDAEAGIIRPPRSDGSRFYDDWEVPCEEG